MEICVPLFTWQARHVHKYRLLGMGDISDRANSLICNLEASVSGIFEVLATKASFKPPYHVADSSRKSADNREQSKACVASLTDNIAELLRYVNEIEARASVATSLQDEIKDLESQLHTKVGDMLAMADIALFDAVAYALCTQFPRGDPARCEHPSMGTSRLLCRLNTLEWQGSS